MHWQLSKPDHNASNVQAVFHYLFIIYLFNVQSNTPRAFIYFVSETTPT